MPPRKKKAPKKVVKQKQKQRQSVVVNVNTTKSISRVKSLPKPVMPKPDIPKPVMSQSFSPMINFPQDNTSSIINAIKSLGNLQPEIIRDVARIDRAEEERVPLKLRAKASEVSHSIPFHSGLASQEFYQVLSDPELQPTIIPIPIQPERTIEEAINIEARQAQPQIFITKAPLSSLNIPKKRSIVKQGQTIEEELPTQFVPSVEEHYRELTQQYREEEPRGILASQATSQFPVPPIEEAIAQAEAETREYVPVPTELKQVKGVGEYVARLEEASLPLEATVPISYSGISQPLEATVPLFPPKNPYVPSQVRETIKQSRAEEPPEETPPQTAREAPVRPLTLSENIEQHNQRIKQEYVSRGESVTQARKDPQYIYKSYKPAEEGKAPRTKTDRQLEGELRQKGLTELIPVTAQVAELIEEPAITLKSFFPIGQLKGKGTGL
jgi:hypothetical protein